jgi:transglutaminase-like putative cysteine protease
MPDTPIQQLRPASRGMRALTRFILALFLWTNLHPALAAAKEELDRPRHPPQHAQTVSHGVLETLRERSAHILAHQDRLDARAEREALKEIRKALKAEDQETQAGFERDWAHIRQHRLPEVIQQRHAQAKARYQANRDRVNAALDELEAASDAQLPDQARQLETLLDEIQPPRISTFDPNNLPFRTPDDKVREPALTPEALDEVLKGTEVPGLSLDQRKRPITATELARIEADEHLYPIERPGIQLASAANQAGLLAKSAPTPPAPEFLAATEDIQITDAIRAKAAELNHHPVEIYNWVRNTIELIPTYGSIQGSQLTLDKKQGNAFDTASLLIALLRASDIPARYVYGTVEVPADKLMNWVGGVEVPAAASNLLGQGGIPHTALTQGGQIKAFRMEHVWVEAFVDFYPSRGARNLTPDAWVPMDASFKQYDYSDGFDLEQGVPLDAEAFLEQAQQGATVNEAEGWVQNLNQANIQSQLEQYQQQLQTYIENQSPDATVGDVLGTKAVRATNPPTLAANLPYKLTAKAGSLAALPDSLQHRFTFSLYASSYDAALDAPLWTYQTETVKLAGKKLTLAYTPSTDADRQTIESYLPEPHADGSPIQPEEFPQSLPAYKIRVTPELRVEGQAVATGGSFTLGTDLISRAGFTNMNLRGYDITQDQQVAGQVGALGISLNGIAASQLETLKQRLEDTHAKLQASQFETLTSEHLTGDLLTATIWSYFAAIESFGRIAQRQAKTVDIPGLSYGYFYANTEVAERWGVIHSISFPGMLMDVGHVRLIDVAADNNQQSWVNYNRLKGQHMSAMEHAIPETFFDDPNDSVTLEGVSAVRALAVAASQGQRIYTLTQANQSQLANVHQSTGVMDAIRAALNAGKEVTVHEAPINYAGFNGAGYIIVDPQTGAGAYLIEGGANGADILIGAIGLFAIGAIVSISGVVAAPFLVSLLYSIALHLALLSLLVGFDGADWSKFCAQGAAIALTFVFPFVFTSGVAATVTMGISVVVMVGDIFGACSFS